MIYPTLLKKKVIKNYLVLLSILTVFFFEISNVHHHRSLSQFADAIVVPLFCASPSVELRSFCEDFVAEAQVQVLSASAPDPTK